MARSGRRASPSTPTTSRLYLALQLPPAELQPALKLLRHPLACPPHNRLAGWFRAFSFTPATTSERRLGRRVLAAAASRQSTRRNISLPFALPGSSGRWSSQLQRGLAARRKPHRHRVYDQVHRPIRPHRHSRSGGSDKRKSEQGLGPTAPSPLPSTPAAADLSASPVSSRPQEQGHHSTSL